MKKNNAGYSRIGLIIISLFIVMFFASCTDFFSTSWFSWAARDPDALIPKVTAGNVNEMAAMFEDDPDGSLALLKKIKDAHSSASGEDKKKLQNAALEVSVNSTGLTGALLKVANNIGDFSNLDENDAKDLLQKTINSMNNLASAGALLLEILPDPDDEEKWDAFIESANPNDLAMAAIVIVLGDVKANYDSIEEYVEEGGNSESIKMAQAIIEVLQVEPIELSDMLAKIIEQLKLQ